MGNYIKYFIFLIPLLPGCDSSQDCIPAPDVSEVQHTVELQRVDQKLFECETDEDISALLSRHPAIEYNFMESQGQASPMVTGYLYRMLHTPQIDTLWQEVQETFGDASELHGRISDGFKLLKYHYPNSTPDVKLKTFFSGLKKDLYINDSVVVVGLDYFLGNDASWRPNNYGYINKRYTPESVPAFVFKYISNKYNKGNPLDNTLLADMVFYGKSYYFTKQMLPCVADSTIIGYNPVEWEGSEMHLKKIWGVFIERELLYETSHIVKSKYVGERPKTFEIGNKCPGRIGRFVGWKIVDAYMESHPDVTLQQLMAETDAKKIFTRSGFKPDM